MPYVLEINRDDLLPDNIFIIWHSKDGLKLIRLRWCLEKF